MEFSNNKKRAKQRFCITIYRRISRYCNNPKSRLYFNYGAEGIECEFTSAREIGCLYERYNASEMLCPHLMRKNLKKNFNKNNCYFIEPHKYISEIYRSKGM